MEENRDRHSAVERLSAVDASFLYAERGGGHTHIGAIGVFEGSSPGAGALRRHVASRQHLVRRLGQRLHRPWPLARPIWVDDPDLDLDYHVQSATPPPEPGEDGLRRFAERLFSQRLDRSKPLWEMWLLDGWDEDRFALVVKAHHALLDGVAGVSLAAAILDLEPGGGDRPVGLEDDRDAPAAGREPQVGAAMPLPRDVRPAPSPIEVAADEARLALSSLRDAGRAAGRLASRAPGSPRDALGSVTRAAAGAAEVARLALSAQPREPLDRPIDPHRRIAWLSTDLEQLKQVGDALGGTVNDVYVTAVAGALGAWLRRRHVDTFGLRPRALVPVSTRRPEEADAMGNRLTALVVELPVEIRDPAARHDCVRELVGEAKASPQTQTAKAIAGAEELAPGPLLAFTSRMHFWDRLYSVLVTNVPGPQALLYLLGRRLDELVPVPFLAPGKALSIAILSYDGCATTGLMTDRAGDDLDLLHGDLRDSIDALVRAAGGHPRPRPRIRTRRFQREVEQAPVAMEVESSER